MTPMMRALALGVALMIFILLGNLATDIRMIRLAWAPAQAPAVVDSPGDAPLRPDQQVPLVDNVVDSLNLAAKQQLQLQPGAQEGEVLSGELDHRANVLRHQQKKKSADPCADDPLDDDCALVGYPTEPMRLQEIRLCDPVLHANLRHSSKELLCVEDPTCIKCRSSYSYMNDLIERFRARSLQNARQKRLRKHFTTINEQGEQVMRQVVILGLNYGQLYLFLNWVCSCERIGINPREFSYVVPTDIKTYDALIRLGFVAETLDWIGKSRISSRYSGLANVGPHAAINAITLAAAEACVLADFPTLVMDVDVVWLGNPLPYLDAVAERRDVIGSYSPRDDGYGFVNGGAVYYIPTKKTKVFISSLVNIAKVKQGSDQIQLNALLRFYRFRQLTLRIVPHSVLNTHWSSKNRIKNIDSNRMPYLVHTVGLHKAPRFIGLGLWFFNETCSSFDAEAHQVAVDAKLYDDPNTPEDAQSTST